MARSGHAWTMSRGAADAPDPGDHRRTLAGMVDDHAVRRLPSTIPMQSPMPPKAGRGGSASVRRAA